jgi:hypothetical protein
VKWNHGDLYRAVLAKYGDQYAEELKSIIYSFPWKFLIAEYHIQEARDSLSRKLAGDEVEGQIRLTKAMFGGLDDAEMEKIGKLLCENEAHIIAYAQTVHSVADNLASIIYYSINFKKEFKGFKKTVYYLENIRDQLNINNKYYELVEKIDTLLECNEFKYLKAFTNTVKHRQLLDHRLSISLISSDHTLVFNKFRYKCETYPAKKGKDLIDSDYRKLKKLYLEIGISVNNVLIP